MEKFIKQGEYEIIQKIDQLIEVVKASPIRAAYQQDVIKHLYDARERIFASIGARVVGTYEAIL